VKRCKDAIQAGKLEDIDVSVDQGKWHNIKEEKIKKRKVQSKLLVVCTCTTSDRLEHYSFRMDAATFPFK
jgi:hypothetical protein